METYNQRRPDDWHVHFRQDDTLRQVVPYTARQFARALVMPNTKPAIRNAADVTRYKELTWNYSGQGFQPLMTVKLFDDSTLQEVMRAHRIAGVIAAKAYPFGVTTNADDGITDFTAPRLNQVFAAMEEHRIMLCVHGEKPDAYCLDREEKFLEVLCRITHRHPLLKIVLEHITTLAAIQFVKVTPNVAATITLHHLFLTTDDIIGGKLRPHNFCMPVAKRPEDRDALREVVFSGNKKFFFGSDSAPHLKGDKECAEGCAGIFSAPVAMPLLVEFFEEHHRLEMLENFTATFGAQWYELPRNESSRLTLIKRPWIVPQEIRGVVPFYAGKEVQWSIA